MTAPLNVIAVSGGAYRPSRTQVLTQVILDEVGRNLNINGRVIELADLARDIGGALSRSELTAESEAQLKAIESADLLIVASPVYRGSYPGQLKHLFDLIDQDALIDTPVLLAATGGQPASCVGDRSSTASAVQFLPVVDPAFGRVRQRVRLQQLPRQL